MSSLGSAIAQVTVEQGETRAFSVRVPDDGPPQYVYDDDPENPVDVPQDIVDAASAETFATVNDNILQAPDDLTGGPLIREVFNVYE